MAFSDVSRSARQRPVEQPDDFSCPTSLLPSPFALALSPPAAHWLDSADSCTLWPLSSISDSAPLSPLDRFPSLTDSAVGSEESVGAGSISPPSLASSSSLPSPSHTGSWSVPTTEPDTLHEQPSPSAALCPVVRHRGVEERRRRREKSALRRLEELCAAERDGGEQQPAVEANNTSAGRQQRQKRKRRKLSVLEASAARIERLERLLKVAELSNRMSEAQVAHLSGEVDGMVTREYQSLQWLDASSALRGSTLLDGRFARTLMQSPTGKLLHANSTYFSLTGFTPGGILQRVLDPVLASPERSATPLCDIPLVREKRSIATTSVGPYRQQPPWTPLRPLRQYPSTSRLMHELLTGVCDNGRTTFRCRWSDGYAYEVNCYVWVVDVEEVEEADGRRWQRPLTFATMTSVDECCRVDEE